MKKLTFILLFGLIVAPVINLNSYPFESVVNKIWNSSRTTKAVIAAVVLAGIAYRALNSNNNNNARKARRSSTSHSALLLGDSSPEARSVATSDDAVTLNKKFYLKGGMLVKNKRAEGVYDGCWYIKYKGVYYRLGNESVLQSRDLLQEYCPINMSVKINIIDDKQTVFLVDQSFQSMDKTCTLNGIMKYETNIEKWYIFDEVEKVKFFPKNLDSYSSLKQKDLIVKISARFTMTGYQGIDNSALVELLGDNQI